MTTQEIIEQIALELNPGYAERMKLYNASTHPEIKMGQEAFERQHQRIIKLITRAVAAGREQYENIAFEMVIRATALIDQHSPQTVADMRETLDRWRDGKAASHIQEMQRRIAELEAHLAELTPSDGTTLITASNFSIQIIFDQPQFIYPLGEFTWPVLPFDLFIAKTMETHSMEYHY